MCEFCTKHGDGRIWYKNAANYSNDLLADIRRRAFIGKFFETTIRDGFDTLSRLEALYKRKGRLPDSLIGKLEGRARTEHFGQVLPIEEIREIVLRASTVVRMPCACRWTAMKKEVRCCYGISYGPDSWYSGIDMGYFGCPPDEGLESLGREEAIAQMEELEEHGAVHTIWTMMTPFIGAICNCTEGDCLALRTLSGIRAETMARAEFVAEVDEGRCDGCGTCAEECQFGAVESVYESGRHIARVVGHKCFGCGLCRRACSAAAISLVPRRV